MITAPPFVPRGQTFSYDVSANVLAYDVAYGVTLTIPLPADARLQSVTQNRWNCKTSSDKVTCSQEEPSSGPHPVTLTVTACLRRTLRRASYPPSIARSTLVV